MIVAIDGPAASGKGTLAKALAEIFGFGHLDTGRLYRAVGLAVLRAGGDPGDPAAAAAAAQALSPDLLGDADLRSQAVAEAASQVAAIPAVRTALLDYQRRFAENPPGGRGAVLDGRDIGTVVCPHADVKIFVTASLEARAERRLKELAASHPGIDLAKVEADLKARDQRDAARSVAPTRRATDALLLDTTNLDIDSVVARAREIVAAAMK